MARTRKDAPRKVKERRLGISDKKDSCSLCAEAEGKKRSITTGFTAIFFAHELNQLQEFVELAKELGYSVESREIRGYLGESPTADGVSNRYARADRSRGKSNFEGYLDPKRAIYSSPRGTNANLLWTSAGRYDISTDPQELAASRGGAGSYFDLLLSAPRRVSSKRNIFTVVSISKTTTMASYSYHYHGADALSYLLYGHCHCLSCEPDERGSKSRLRKVTGELKKSFNSGDYDAIEDISQELTSMSSGAYRDTMNC